MPINLRTDAANAGSPVSRSAAQIEPISSRSSISNIDGFRIHSMEFGSGSDVLLLIHGLSGSYRWWTRNVSDLARDRLVIVPDLVGFGRSRPVRTLPSIPELAGILLDWLKDRGHEKISVVGHSMGGQISVHLAARAPERIDRLVLADPSGVPRPLSPGALARFAAEVSPLWRWGDPRFLHVIATDAITAGPRILFRAIQNLLLDDVRPLLPRISAPTLLIWGERDSLVPLADAQTFREGIPEARLAVLRGAGHNSMVDRPADFNRLVRRFLDGEPVGQ